MQHLKKKILLILLITLFSSSIFASDEKPGRFFKDQPDVNDDYQIHFIYFLAKKTKDKERDINGWVEKEVKKIDDLFFKMTGDKQRLKFDYRKDGKLDISFARMDRKARKGGWNVSCVFCMGCGSPKNEYKSFRVFLYEKEPFDDSNYQNFKNDNYEIDDLIILKRHGSNHIEYDYEIVGKQHRPGIFDKIGKDGLDEIVDEVLQT